MAPMTTMLIAKNNRRLAAFHGDRLHCQAARPTDAANMPVANWTEHPKMGTKTSTNLGQAKPKQMKLMGKVNLSP